MFPPDETIFNNLNRQTKSKPKIFSVLSVRNDVNFADLRDRLSLSLVMAQDTEEAIKMAKGGIVMMGLPVEKWNVGHMVVWAETSDFALADERVGALKFPSPVPPVQPTTPPAPLPLEQKREKSVAELSSYVRYVFDKATPEQKAVAETVINQFTKQHATATPAVKN